jgi:VanZ family protein
LICLPGKVFPKVKPWFEELDFDKIIHITMFGILNLLFVIPFYKSNLAVSVKKKSVLLISVIFIGWGFITECIQLFVPKRSFDLLDWLADSVGILIVYWYYSKKISRLVAAL